MEFKYWVYIVTLCLIVLMIIYALLTHIFKNISLKKKTLNIKDFIIESEQIEIPQLKEYGYFWVDEALNYLTNSIILNNYNSFMDIDMSKDYEIAFLSFDKKINEQQLRAFYEVINFDIPFYSYLLGSICDYYNEYYYFDEDEDWNVKMNLAKLKYNIELGNIRIDIGGTIGLSFGAKWDTEHGLGVLIKNNKIIDIGGADVAIL